MCLLALGEVVRAGAGGRGRDRGGRRDCSLWEHRLVKADDLSRIDAAFFTMNGYVSVIFFVFWAADIFLTMTMPVFEDARLEPIRRKVEAEERLSFDDGVTLYRSPDLLGVGWLANVVRERMSGNKTFFNVNRHINPTDVCVASCRLCAFGKRAKDPKAYTMSLEQVWETWQGTSATSEAVDGVSHRRRAASGADSGLVLPDAAGLETALSPGAPEGVHHGHEIGYLAHRRAKLTPLGKY